jgi:signal transduction histidine kinase
VLLERARRGNALHAALLKQLKHELRTPFAAMSNALAMIERFGEAAGPEKRARWVQLARLSATELDTLLHGLDEARALAAGATSGTPRRVRVADCARDLQRAFASRGAARLRCRDEIPADTAWRIDPVLLRHALRPVVANALLYSPATSTVELRFTRAPERIAITVTDSGRGVPSDEADRIFEPYYRASNARDIPGAGLGLTLARAAAEFAGGSLQLQTGTRPGAVFHLSLPASLPGAAGE